MTSKSFHEEVQALGKAIQEALGFGKACMRIHLVIPMSRFPEPIILFVEVCDNGHTENTALDRAKQLTSERTTVDTVPEELQWKAKHKENALFSMPNPRV